MVLKSIVKNEKGETLKTKEGVELVDYKLEDGDVFIPIHNSLLTNSNTRKVDGKEKTIVNHKLKVKVKGHPKEGEEEEIFVSLTPAQAKSLNKKISEDVLLNQNLFQAYTYKDSEGNEWVGVGFKKKNIPAKSFTDFEEEGII